MEDFTTGSDPQANSSEEQLTHHSGINPVNQGQLSDDTAGVFEDIIKVGIYLDIEWVPRSLNEKADFLSKIVDYDDWEPAPRFFRQLDERLIALPPITTRRSQNIFLGPGILEQPELTRFSKTGNMKIA